MIGYDVAGFRLRVEVASDVGPAATALAPIERLFGRFRSLIASEGSWSLRIGRSDHRPPAPSDGLRKAWEGSSPAGFHVVNWAAAGRRRCDLEGVGTLDVDIASRIVLLDLLPQAEAHAAHYFLTSILCEGLIAAGHCVVHAACLERETPTGNRSVLIVAPSGTGKSTTALAMTDDGWRLMGDDLTVVTPTPRGVLAWGFPRFCNIRRPTRALLPWLEELPLMPTTVPETFALSLEDLGSRARQDAPVPAAPAAIICLERPNPLGHRIQPLDRAAALMHIAEENVQPIEDAGEEFAGRAFAAFGELVRVAPAYALSAGPRLSGIGAALVDQLSL